MTLVGGAEQSAGGTGSKVPEHGRNQGSGHRAGILGNFASLSQGTHINLK